jgi:hypothetical protein
MGKTILSFYTKKKTQHVIMQNHETYESKSKPIDIKAKFFVEEIRELFPQSSNSISQIHIVILFFFLFLFA